MKTAYLVLENGTVFEGQQIGALTDTIGELVFTTGMSGYIETLTDPSYAGQIVVQTFPLIGNYGVIPQDYEGVPAVKGYVVRELCDSPSNFRSEGQLNSFLIENKICGICGVDTREITRIIRECGVMNAAICSQIPNKLDKIKSFAIKNVVAQVSREQKKVYNAIGEKKYSVALIDYGVKHGIVENLQRLGCEVTAYPQKTTAEEIIASNPDGIALSNGPGDPEENVFCIEQIKKLLGKKPMFGICLGHQLVALAMGGKTIKLKYGHRGTNQPVRETVGTRTFITSQNHGYAVVADSLKNLGQMIFENANDGSCEGMFYPEMKCFTVQFHPEARSGPHDTDFLFKKFISMMGGEKRA